MARKPRVVIPTNPGAVIKLTGAIYAKHVADGAKSPLLILESPTLDEIGLDVQKVVQTQARIEELEKELKALYGERDPHLASFTDINRRTRDTLLAKYAANPAKAGEHGFDVIEATAPSTGGPKTPKV
jgi:hypothetical protein